MFHVVKTILIVSFFILSGSLDAQNLVPNPSFEDYTSCPTSVAQITLATPWVTPTTGSPDYFNACATSSYCSVPTNFFGNQIPRTGDAYAQAVFYPSFGADFREYSQVKLISPLIAGQTYDVSFYTSLQDKAARASNNIGIYISTVAPTSGGSINLPVTPQINETSIITDYTNWTLISGTYTAVGGEEYITIGNFYNDASTNTSINPVGNSMYATFYLIEDVCVTPQGGTGCVYVLPIILSHFEIDCNNHFPEIKWSTSAEINNDYFTIEKSADALNWEIVTYIQGAGNSNQQINYSYVDDNYENNNQTTYYRLKQTDFDGKFEYFNIVPIQCRGATSLIIFPNPASNTITISGKEINKIEIIDLLGRIVKQVEPVGNNIEIDISTFSNGSYMIRIYGINQSSVHKIIKK